MRDQLYRDIQASPYRENKVSVRQYLLGEGRFQLRGDRVRSKVAAALGGQSKLRESIDNTIELAAYLPVKAHFKSWSGDANIIVASAIKDHVTPVGYRIGGAPFPLTAETPPTVPVLAIVAAELKFEETPSFASMDGGCDPATAVVPCPDETGVYIPPSRGTPTAPGVWMNAGTVNGSYESWFNGDPEFEVFLTFRSVAATSMTERQCAGEYGDGSDQPGIQSSEYNFDWQEPESWVGLVKLATVEQFAAAEEADNGAMLLLVEDDATSCRIKTDQGTLNSAISAAAAGVAFDKAGNDLELVVRGVQLAVNLLTLSGNLNSDDFIGLLVERNEVLLCSVPSDFSHAIVGDDASCRGFVNIIGIPE